jgi:hypothetical protein
MDYMIDLDPTRLILRVTVGNVLTDELSREIHRTVKRLASRGGPYAGSSIFLKWRMTGFPPKSPQNS